MTELLSGVHDLARAVRAEGDEHLDPHFHPAPVDDVGRLRGEEPVDKDVDTWRRRDLCRGRGGWAPAGAIIMSRLMTAKTAATATERAVSTYVRDMTEPPVVLVNQ